MADLFDMKVGGIGFHLTAHMIALAALFVACFAITGYITFRNGSIAESDLDFVPLTLGDPLGAATVSSLYNGVFYEKAYQITVTVEAIVLLNVIGASGVMIPKALVDDLPVGSWVEFAKLETINAQAVDSGPIIVSAPKGSVAGAAGDALFDLALGDSTEVTNLNTTHLGNKALTTATNNSLYLGASDAGIATGVEDSFKVSFLVRSTSPL